LTQGKGCAICKEVLQEQTIIPATGHTAGEAVVENEADAGCENEGSYDNVVYCTVCEGEISRETVTVDALGHTEGEIVVENKVDATCTVGGSYDNVVYCTVCGEEISRNTVTVDALGHDMQQTSAQVDAKCEVAGKTAVLTCANGCGKTEGGEVIPAKEHQFTLVGAGYAPSCTKDGCTDIFGCMNGCGETEGGEVIPATGHDMTHHGAVAPDCTTDGTVEYWSCSKCEKNYAEVAGATVLESIVDPATGHDMTHHGAVAPDCTTDGTVEYWSCSNCKKNYAEEAGTTVLESIVDPATGHDMTHHGAVAPGCTTDGTIEYWSCSNCAKNFADDAGNIVLESIVDAAKGHSYGEPVWNWTGSDADGYSAAAVTFTCHCAHYETVNGTVESQTTAATTEADGKIVYTATATFDEKEYSDSKTVVIPKIELTLDISVETVGTNDFGAQITAPEGGWKEGTNTFEVSCDKACVVVVSYDNGVTYEILDAAFITEVVVDGKTTIGTYSFTADNMADNTLVKVLLKGDINGDGKFNVRDVSALSRASAGNEDLSILADVLKDTNGDGKFNVRDVSRLSRASAGTEPLTW
jgi:Zn-finger protein